MFQRLIKNLKSRFKPASRNRVKLVEADTTASMYELLEKKEELFIFIVLTKISIRLVKGARKKIRTIISTVTYFKRVTKRNFKNYVVGMSLVAQLIFNSPCSQSLVNSSASGQPTRYLAYQYHQRSRGQNESPKQTRRERIQKGIIGGLFCAHGYNRLTRFKYDEPSVLKTIDQATALVEVGTGSMLLGDALTVNKLKPEVWYVVGMVAASPDGLKLIKHYKLSKERINELETQLNQANIQLEETSSQLQGNTAKITSSDKTIAILQRKTRDLKKDVKVLTQQNSNLTEKLEKERAVCMDYTIQSSQLEVEAEDLLHTLIDDRKALSFYKEELQQQTAKNRFLHDLLRKKGLPEICEPNLIGNPADLSMPEKLYNLGKETDPTKFGQDLIREKYGSIGRFRQNVFEEILDVNKGNLDFKDNVSSLISQNYNGNYEDFLKDLEYDYTVSKFKELLENTQK